MEDNQICIGNKGFKSYLAACTEQLKKTPQIEILSRGNLNSKAIHLAGCLQDEQNHEIADISISRRNDPDGVVSELRIVVNKAAQQT